MQLNSEQTPIRYVAGVSWPRSGHHLLVRLMSGYYGDKFHYCEFYTEHLDCCRQFPCTKAPAISFSKNHDFKLEISSTENVPYIVQYRNFYNSVVSDFELYIRVNGPDSDTKQNFISHSIAQARKYNKFCNKWIEKEQADNILLVPYEDLISETKKIAKKCIQHFSPGVEINSERLTAVVSDVDGERVENRTITRLPNIGVHKSRDYREFRYYDEKWFITISDILASD